MKMSIDCNSDGIDSLIRFAVSSDQVHIEQTSQNVVAQRGVVREKRLGQKFLSGIGRETALSTNRTPKSSLSILARPREGRTRKEKTSENKGRCGPPSLVPV